MHALTPLRCLAPLALLAGSALSQSMNIDIGPAGSAVPPSSYAAAGLPGHWNAVVLPHTTPSTAPQGFDEMLLDLEGNATGVGIHQFGGQNWFDLTDPLVTGSDDALLGDALVANNPSLDSCLYLNGLEDGIYEVLTYVYYPEQPQVMHKTLFDFVPGVLFAQGAWTGQHEEGITFTRTIVPVNGGFMGPHAGMVLGGSTVLGGATCGMQLRKLECTSASFCSSTANSTGQAAVIGSNGDCSIEAGAFELSAGPVPDQPGLFFFSSGQANGGAGVVFGNGLRCVGDGSTIYRLPVEFATGGVLSHGVDFGPLPFVTPGSTWNFQAWYRDPAGGGAGFDLSDGLTVTFH